MCTCIWWWHHWPSNCLYRRKRSFLVCFVFYHYKFGAENTTDVASIISEIEKGANIDWCLFGNRLCNNLCPILLSIFVSYCCAGVVLSQREPFQLEGAGWNSGLANPVFVMVTTVCKKSTKRLSQAPPANRCCAIQGGNRRPRRRAFILR